VFTSYEDMYEMQKEVKFRSNKGKVVETLEEEPIKIDFKINGVHKLKGIPIEGLGVFSYIGSTEGKFRSKVEP
jgi:hypothetical protein